MEGMRHYGWGAVDSDGDIVTWIVFGTLKEAEKYTRTLNEHHYGRNCTPVELFIKEKRP